MYYILIIVCNYCILWHFVLCELTDLLAALFLCPLAEYLLALSLKIIGQIRCLLGEVCASAKAYTIGCIVAILTAANIDVKEVDNLT